MSIVVASGEAISKNLLNHSSSKQMYSFPRTPRFLTLKKCSSATFFYNIPESLSDRKAALGYGNKKDFTKTKKTNTPYYMVPRIFEAHQGEGTPKYSFGLGRNYFEKVVVGNGKMSTSETISPGPGRYNFLKPFGNFSYKYSIPKNAIKTAGLGKVVSPGPANYSDPLKLNPQGKYSSSKFRNTRASGWSLSRLNRFNYFRKTNKNNNI